MSAEAHIVRIRQLGILVICDTVRIRGAGIELGSPIEPSPVQSPVRLLSCNDCTPLITIETPESAPWADSESAYIVNSPIK